MKAYFSVFNLCWKGNHGDVVKKLGIFSVAHIYDVIPKFDQTIYKKLLDDIRSQNRNVTATISSVSKLKCPCMKSFSIKDKLDVVEVEMTFN